MASTTDRLGHARPYNTTQIQLRAPRQVTKGLAKTIRAMADVRICNGLAIMRAQTATLERIEGRIDDLEGTPLSYGSQWQDRPALRTH